MRRKAILLLISAICVAGMMATAADKPASGGVGPRYTYPNPEDVEIELIDAHFDYEFLPKTDYQEEDVLGKFYFTCRIKGLTHVAHHYTRAHYLSPENTDPRGSVYEVNPAGDVKDFYLPIASWGQYCFVGFRTGEGRYGYTYPLVICTTDYVDPEIMDYLLAGTRKIEAPEGVDAGVSITGDEINFHGLADSEVAVSIYDLQGHLIISETIYPEGGSYSLSAAGMAPGLYVVRATGLSQSITEKILRK